MDTDKATAVFNYHVVPKEVIKFDGKEYSIVIKSMGASPDDRGAAVRAEKQTRPFNYKAKKLNSENKRKARKALGKRKAL